MNTLDVLNGITLSGTSINIGRDLNLLNVGGNISLSDGSQFNIGRNLGLVSQPPKGTGTGTNVLTLNLHECRELDRHRDDSRRRLLHPGQRRRRPDSVIQHRAGTSTTRCMSRVPLPPDLPPRLRHTDSQRLARCLDSRSMAHLPLCSRQRLSQFWTACHRPEHGLYNRPRRIRLSRQRSDYSRPTMTRHALEPPAACRVVLSVTPPSHPTNKSTVSTDCRAIRSERIGRRPAIGTSRFVPGSPRNGRGGRMRPEPHFAESRIHEPVCTNSSPLVRFAVAARHRSPQVSS